MACVTIRNLEEFLKFALRVQAACHDRSMAGEARNDLRRSKAQGIVARHFRRPAGRAGPSMNAVEIEQAISARAEQPDASVFISTLATRNRPGFEGCGIEVVNPWTKAGSD